MRAKTIVAFLAATAIVGAWAVPAVASAAKPRRIRQPASVDAVVQGHASGGFDFILLTLGSRGDILWLTKQPSAGSGESVAYFATSHGRSANLATGRLDVKIGHLGRFRGRFVPDSTKTEKPGEGCTGAPTLIEKGHFVGSFAFYGESGFSTVDARREQGILTRQRAISCPTSGPPDRRRHRSPRREREEKERRQEEFRLLAGDVDGDLLFRAEREGSPEPEEGSPTAFSASMTERTRGLQVSRSASAIVFGDETAAAFQVPNLTEPLTEATVSPPAPFSGSATFHLDGPKTADWAGDLAVELPGAGTVPLSGEGISAGLCHGSHCTKTLTGLLQRELEASPDASYYGGEATTEPAS